MHVELWGKFQCSQLIHLLLQPSVLLRQILAASLQELTVNLRLLQLGPVKISPLKTSGPKGITVILHFLMPKMPFRHRRIVSPCPPVLKPHLHLSWSQVQLLSQGQLLLLQVSTPPFSAKIPKYPSEEKFIFFPPFSQKPNTESL